MKRLDNWEGLFQDILQERSSTLFQRGTHDCAILACDIILAITGEDIGQKFRGKYKTKRGAVSVLRKAGGTLTQVIAKVLGEEFNCPEIHPLKAQRGDVAVLKTEDSEAVGIVDLNGVDIIIADVGCPIGYLRLPISIATQAWRTS